MDKALTLDQASKDNIKAYLLDMRKRIEDAIIYNLSYVGDECLTAARLSTGYLDQTGNLRSSIGFIVLRDGEIVKQSTFEVVKKGQEGAEKGRKLVQQLQAEFPRGYVLVFVAGMEYAGYVADMGRDVLDSAALLADRLVPEMLDKVRKQINEQQNRTTG